MKAVQATGIVPALLLTVLMYVWPAFLGAQSKVESVPGRVPALEGSQPPEASRAGTTPVLAELAVGPADLLDVSLFGVSDFQSEARVNNAGDISLPLIGTLHWRVSPRCVYKK
jgi:protein involved in polysaccharide export with SLBB domain